LRTDAGIPLTRPFGDSWSAAADASRRASGSWGRVGGWFNHGEVPENNHWDMGAFRWRSALAAARGARLAPGPHAAAPARGRAAGAG
jgi:hypothetical protein